MKDRESGGGQDKAGKNNNASGWRRAGMTTALLLLLSGLVSCATTKPASKQSAVWERANPEIPDMLAKCYYAPGSVSGEIATALEDEATPVRSSARMGNGLLSVRFLNSAGKPLPIVLCGGALVIDGVAGADYQIEVKNHSNMPLEVLPLVDGLDLHTGEPANFERNGDVLKAGARVIYKNRHLKSGGVVALQFADIKTADAIYQPYAGGTLGSVNLAVFEPRDSAHFRDTPQWKGMKNAGPTYTRYTPQQLPYQYR